MCEEPNKVGSDVLGLQPLAKSAEIATQGAVDTVREFLSRLCWPAAKEFGLLLKDKVHDWRQQNLVTMTQRAEQKMKDNHALANVHAHPRIVNTIVENASWTDDAVLQDLWSGLLASSCTEKGDDDSNLIFTDLLSRMTKMQAKIIRWACDHSKIYVTRAGLIVAIQHEVTIEQLREISEEADIHRLDRELDHLRGLGLLDEAYGGFSAMDTVVYVTPSTLALHMYVRCQGSRLSPIDFFQSRGSLIDMQY